MPPTFESAPTNGRAAIVTLPKAPVILSRMDTTVPPKSISIFRPVEFAREVDNDSHFA